MKTFVGNFSSSVAIVLPLWEGVSYVALSLKSPKITFFPISLYLPPPPFLLSLPLSNSIISSPLPLEIRCSDWTLIPRDKGSQLIALSRHVINIFFPQSNYLLIIVIINSLYSNEEGQTCVAIGEIVSLIGEWREWLWILVLWCSCFCCLLFFLSVIYMTFYVVVVLFCCL